MNYSELLNLSSSEEIKFQFNGKLGRILMNWLQGQWIITTNRLFFFSNELLFTSRILFSQFGRPLALIILLSEIKEVIKKQDKIIVRYLRFSFLDYGTSINELSIAFSLENYEIDSKTISASDLLDAVYNYLTDPTKGD